MKLTKIHNIALQNNSALQYTFITAVPQTNIVSLSVSLEEFFPIENKIWNSNHSKLLLPQTCQSYRLL